VSGRTFVIGDIHGDLAALLRLLERLPPITAEDTVVFLGDYVDRGPDSRGVLERVWQMQRQGPARVVPLRGNHEDQWVSCYAEPNPGFLLPRRNGCAEMFRSMTGGPPLDPDDALQPEEVARLLQVSTWLPEAVVRWMDGLPYYYEDEHAIYVHAGLEGEGKVWFHPSQGKQRPLLWMREPDFYSGYSGKRLVFGHTLVTELPLDHLGPIRRLFDDPGDVWTRGDLIGIDTGCGKGGFLSAIELPRCKVYESR
jgi:serine/threonine protein phosphatase 1